MKRFAWRRPPSPLSLLPPAPRHEQRSAARSARSSQRPQRATQCPRAWSTLSSC